MDEHPNAKTSECVLRVRWVRVLDFGFVSQRSALVLKTLKTIKTLKSIPYTPCLPLLERASRILIVEALKPRDPKP